METRKEIQQWLERKWRVEDYFINILDNLIEDEETGSIGGGSSYINYTHKDTGKIYMKYSKKTKRFWVDGVTIWSYFQENYSSNPMEIKNLLKMLVSEHLNIKEVTPIL